MSPLPAPVTWPAGCSQRLWDQVEPWAHIRAMPGSPHVSGVGSQPPAGGDEPGPQAMLLTIHGHGPVALSSLTWLLGLEMVPIP